MTLSALLALYRRHHLDLCPRTIEELDRTVRQFGKDRPIEELTDESVLGFMAGFSAGRSPVTVNGKRRDLLALWRFAHRKRLVPIGPLDVPKLREPTHVPRAWTVADVETLVAYARTLPGMVAAVPAKHWWPALVLTIYWSGARISSVMAVRTADYFPGDRYFVSRREKNGRERVYWLADQAIAAIAPVYDPTRPTLFVWDHCRRWLFGRFRRIVEGSGLKASKGGRDLFHRLRRTCLSYCAALDLAIAQQQAGHSRPDTTVKHYIDPTIARPKTAADVLPVPRCGAF